MNSMVLSKRKMSSKDMVSLLNRINIFDKLIHKEVRTISVYLDYLELEKGEVLFKEGDKGDFMCFIVSGTLNVLKASKSPGEMVIATMGKGRSIGEMSIVDNYPRSATVTANTTTALVVLNRERFDRLTFEHPAIGIKIMKGVTRLLSLNLRKTTSRLIDYMMPLG